MSEQENIQTQVEPTVQEEPKQAPMILGKFKDQDALIESYKQLERRLHDRPKSEEPKTQESSSVTPDEGGWKQKNAILEAQANVSKRRKDEASKALNDSDVLSAVRRALGSRDAIAEFEKEVDAGQVSSKEIARLARLGGLKRENESTLPESKEAVKAQAQDAEVKYMMRMLRDSTSAYFNQQASDHKHVVAKVNEIKQRLGM